MKTVTSYLATTLLVFTSCNFSKNKKDDPQEETEPQSQMIYEDNSRTALDWSDTYRGIMPCADCEGIATEITLNKDLSYSKKVRYIGKSDEIIQSEGTFSWDETGNNIVLNEAEGEHYKVGEIALMVLDQDGKLISSSISEHYKLVKASMDTGIVGKYWKLIELEGQKVEVDPNLKKEIHLVLQQKDSIVSGFGGCNGFSGPYELDDEGQRLSFSRIRSTLMACEALQTEEMFHKALEKTDNYTVNGDTLLLNSSDEDLLAKFVANYLQ